MGCRTQIGLYLTATEGACKTEGTLSPAFAKVGSFLVSCFSHSATMFAIFITSREPAHLPTVSGLLLLEVQGPLPSRTETPAASGCMTLARSSWVGSLM